jgi:hypothetical protein
MAPLSTSVAPAFVTSTVRVSSRVMSRPTVFVPAVLSESRPSTPSLIALPVTL